MEEGSVKNYGEEMFQKFTTEEKVREQYLFAKALHNNEQLRGDVERDFHAKLNEICGQENHQQQKIEFRRVLIENIRNMIMWQEYFKRDSNEESEAIFTFLNPEGPDLDFNQFEKQSAYFQLYSEALFSLYQCILNKFYDEVIENNYSAMLTQTYRVYYKNLFDSIMAQTQGKAHPASEMIGQLKEVFAKVEEPALRGEERVYKMEAKS